MNGKKKIRYCSVLAMIALMVGVAELTGEREIIFPEMAALTIGLWISDKHIWQVGNGQLILLMTLAAVAGVLIVRYSPLPFIFNIVAAFVIAGLILTTQRSTLYPLVSALILPVLLHTTSWVYPLSVLTMTIIIITVKHIFERNGVRSRFEYTPSDKPIKSAVSIWTGMTACILLIAAIGYYSTYIYIIIPPLIVSFVEFVNTKAGFRNRPVLTVLLLSVCSLIGSTFQLVGHFYLGLPLAVVAFSILIAVFGLFEWLGKFFAPAGAISLIPLLLPEEVLPYLPLEVFVGAVFFIAIAMIFFQKCYKWSRAQIVYCLIPHYLISRIYHKKETNKKGYLKE